MVRDQKLSIVEFYSFQAPLSFPPGISCKVKRILDIKTHFLSVRPLTPDSYSSHRCLITSPAVSQIRQGMTPLPAASGFYHFLWLTSLFPHNFQGILFIWSFVQSICFLLGAWPLHTPRHSLSGLYMYIYFHFPGYSCNLKCFFCI